MTTFEKFSLEGKVAIVTGATRGLGQGIAIGLAGAGADIVCVGRSDDSETRQQVEALGRRYLNLRLDVAEESTPEKVVEETVKAFGKVDILVNAAGITRRVMAIDIDRKDWQDVLDVNLTGLFFMCQAAARQFIKQGGGGKIINIGSMTSYQGGIKVIPYTASKAAVRNITMHMCNEWAAKYNIHVNCIAPGPFHSDLDADLPPSFLEQIDRDMPMHRFGEPIELGAYCVFLASPAARMVTGTVCVSDGGLMCALG